MEDLDLVARYLSQVEAACNSCNAFSLLQSVALPPEGYKDLQEALGCQVRCYPPLTQAIDQACAGLDLSPSHAAQSKRLTSMVFELLSYIQSYPPPHSNPPPPGAYDAWVKVYTSANAVFSLPDTVWITPAFKFITRQLVSLAIRTDCVAPSRLYTKTIDAAGRLSKSAGLAANDRTAAPAQQTKRIAVLSLANASFRAYFCLNNTRLCETVLGSVNNALLMNRRFAEESDSGENPYTMAERVTYHYYLGKIRLFQHRVQLAAYHLRWAFDHCTTAHFHNKRTILIPLVAVYAILGRYASSTLLNRFDLQFVYGNMLQYLKTGNAYGVMQELEKHRDWLRPRGIYMLLCEKLVLSLWRNLFQRCIRYQAQNDMSISNRPPTLHITNLVRPAQLAWNDTTLAEDDVECMVANLVEQVSTRRPLTRQGLMKAYILHSKGVVVLQRGPHKGFPPIASVYLS